MTRDELSKEVRAVMFVLSKEAALDGFDDRLLADAHDGLMALIDKHLAENSGQPVKRRRHRAF